MGMFYFCILTFFRGFFRRCIEQKQKQKYDREEEEKREEEVEVDR